jgi:hypothetical protein
MTMRADRPIYSGMLRPAYLSQKLDRPLPTKDGGTLRTIREACDYMTAMGNLLAGFLLVPSDGSLR